MLSPKNHIRGKRMRDATVASVDKAAYNQKGRREAGLFIFNLMRVARGQYFAMSGPPNL